MSTPPSRLLTQAAALGALALLTGPLHAQSPLPSPVITTSPPSLTSGKPLSETVITADKQAEFDSAERKAVFTGNVRVKDPSFDIECDTLTAWLDKDEGGLSRAIAEGRVRVVQEKNGPGGKKTRTTGRGGRLVWDAKAGVARLSGNAQVEQGINLHIAESPDTVMILTRDGELTTSGPSRTVLKPQND